MTLFETVKTTVRAPEAARMYGLPPDWHGMLRCPFHDDQHPSLKLNEDYFYCFGCGANAIVSECFFDSLHLLKDWKEQYASNSMEDQWDDRFVEACQMLDYIEYLADLLILGDEST